MSPHDPKNDDTVQAEQIEQTLRAAAGQLEGADLKLFQTYLDGGMYVQAYDVLRDLAGERATPFGFWVNISRAADLLGVE